MNKKEHVLISGGGPVGCLLAICLRQLGYTVTIHEKRADIRKVPEEKGRSINLVLTSRGLHALKQFKLLDSILGQTVPVTGRMIHSREGELKYQPYGSHPEECNYSVSRNNINRVLLDKVEEAGVKVFFESELEVVNFFKKKATFSDTEFTYDRLIGADGAGSTLRKLLIQSFPEEYQKKTDWLSWGYKELYMPATENGAFPIRKDALHIWPERELMFMGLANYDHSFTMTLYLPKTGDKNSFLSLDTKEKVKALLLERFADAYPLLQKPEEDFLRHPHGRLGTTSVNKWYWQDSVLLVGDAAHTMVPFFGQGLNFSFEDCSLLLNLIQEFDGNWKEILFEFDRIQRVNGNAISQMALDNFVEMKDRVSDDRFLLRKAVERKLEEAFPTMFRSRYGYVTYTLNSLKDISELGEIQDSVLEELISGIDEASEVDLIKAENLLETKVKPFLTKHKINTKRFSL